MMRKSILRPIGRPLPPAIRSSGSICITPCAWTSCAWTVVLVWSAAAAGVEPLPRPHPPLTESAVAVITLDYEGGAGPLRQHSAPALTIDADGRLVMPDLYGTGDGVVSRLSQQELQLLVDGLLVEDGLAVWDARRMSQQLTEVARQSGLSAEIAGAAVLRVQVRTAEGVYQAQCPAASLLAERFPQIEDLRRITAVERRLTNVMAVARVGGAEEAERIAAAATAALHREHPQAARLTAMELSMVRTGVDGSRFCQFVRPCGDSASGRQGDLIVYLVETPDEPVRVSVSEGPAIR